MISVADALAQILDRARPLSAESLPISPATLGLVLAEDVISDLAIPPFDKAMMDGYAVRSADLINGTAVLNVIEEISAGHTAKLPIDSGQAIQIMTGAPIPIGADAVIAVERTNSIDAHRVRIIDKPSVGLNILRQGAEMRPGDVLLRPGAVLRPQEFGLLATVGRTAAKVHPPPRVAIISTGDELVDATIRPGPGQIRNGNGPMLLAQVARAGGLPSVLGIARDTPESLRSLISDGLNFDILLLSGGVSAGKLDLVPGVLSDLGVEPHFHKVEMKPGKPVFFGTKGQTLIFGLPGNPVSSLACFELFVRPAIRGFRGHADPGPRMVQAELAEDFRYRTDRPTYHPAWLDETPTGYRVRIVPWFGSPDLRALIQANALAVLPKGDHVHERKKMLDVICMDAV